MVKIKELARDLRRNQTQEEKRLWFLLQDRRFSGFKFRRQVWIDQCCVDFCCYKARLIIELDGGYHNRTANKIYDLVRTKYLEGQGFRLLRFWNNEVSNHETLVLEKIREALFYPLSVSQLDQKALRLTSSPARGEEERK